MEDEMETLVNLSLDQLGPNFPKFSPFHAKAKDVLPLQRKATVQD